MSTAEVADGDVLDLTYDALPRTKRLFPTGRSSTATSISHYLAVASSSPYYRGGLAACVYGGSLFVFGGLDLINGTVTFYGDVWARNLSSGAWSLQVNNSAPFAPTARYGSPGVVVANFFLIFGGWDGSGYQADTWYYDLDNFQWVQITTASAPSGRQFHCLVSAEDGQFFYLFGGKTGAGVSSELWRFDLFSQAWGLVSSGTIPARTNASMALSNGKLFVFGGGDDSDVPMNDLWAWTISGGGWTHIVVSSPPTARFGCGMTAYSGILHILGGAADLSSALDEYWTYNVASPAWTQITSGSRPDRRSSHVFLKDPVGSSGYVFGGFGSGGYGNGSYNDFWVNNLSSNPFSFVSLPGGMVWVRGPSFVYLGRTFSISLVGSQPTITIDIGSSTSALAIDSIRILY